VADALHTPGVVSAQDGRLDDAGLIASQGAGMDVRTGVLHGPGSTALITGTADTAPMAVLVAAHHGVTRRQVSEGVYRGATEAPVRVSIDAAPASDSRIDVVWVKQNDASAGVLTPDATTEWLVSKTTGTVAASPVKPAIPVGALELGTVTVAAGATATNGAGVTIANTARQTVARGARIPVRNAAERDALTTFPGLEVYRLDTDTVELHDGTAWGGLPGRHLLTRDQTSEARATSTTRVVLPGIASTLTLSAARRVIFTLDVQIAQGVSGGELGRVTLVVDGTESRRAQWHSPVAGGGGEVSPALTYSVSLAAGAHSVDANLIRVVGGSEVLVIAAQLVVVDGGRS
jgi:hypothetical protein